MALVFSKGLIIVSKASADTKAAHPHGASADDLLERSEGRGSSHSELDFLSSVRSLKEAEKSAEALLEQAKKEAAQTEADARARAATMAAQAQEKAVQAKNEILAKIREETKKETDRILADAKKQSDKMRGKRLSDKDAEALSQSQLLSG